MFFLGVIFGLLLAAAATIPAYKRFLRAERNAREAQRLAELGTLTGGLAHEIKNPLSTVQLNLQLLREDIADAQPRILSRLGTVQRETSRLREILDDFLKYAGKLEVDRKPTDLNELLQDLVDFFVPQAQLQRVQIRLQKPNEPVIASVDAKLIKQAILNLMLNAVQAMPNGGELILSLRRDGESATIEVIDTGNGIPPEGVQKIFNAYYTTKKGGTGLGLAMTRRIIQAHDGEIAVTSEVGKGSDFKITIPIGH